MENMLRQQWDELVEEEVEIRRQRAIALETANELQSLSRVLRRRIRVPFTKVAFLEGEVKHPGEVVLHLGAGHFLQCTTEHAGGVLLRRYEQLGQTLDEVMEREAAVMEHVRALEEVQQFGSVGIVEDEDGNLLDGGAVLDPQGYTELPWAHGSAAPYPWNPSDLFDDEDDDGDDSERPEDAGYDSGEDEMAVAQRGADGQYASANMRALLAMSEGEVFAAPRSAKNPAAPPNVRRQVAQALSSLEPMPEEPKKSSLKSPTATKTPGPKKSVTFSTSKAPSQSFASSPILEEELEDNDEEQVNAKPSSSVNPPPKSSKVSLFRQWNS